MMPEFWVKTSPRKLLQWSGDDLLLSERGGAEGGAESQPDLAEGRLLWEGK